jgi:hypothetical protein
VKHVISKVVLTEGKKLHLCPLFWSIAELSVLKQMQSEFVIFYDKLSQNLACLCNRVYGFDTLIRLNNNESTCSSEVSKVGMSLASGKNRKERIRFNYGGNYEL